MKFYFILLYRRIGRILAEQGILPIIGLFGILSGTASIMALIYWKLEWPEWWIGGLAVLAIVSISEHNRTYALRSIFEDSTFYRIRLLENFGIAIPFLVALVYEYHFAPILVVLIVAITKAFHAQRLNFMPVLPTPFRRYPFEFIRGFRKFWLIIAMNFFILTQGVRVQNYNLCLATLFISFLIGMSYYTKPEPFHFTWIHSRSPFSFLKHKILRGNWCMTLISLPFLALIVYYFPSKLLVTASVVALGYFFLTSMIIVKYSAYPKEINVAQGILYGFSLAFPPLLFITLPYFYKKAIKQLDTILR